MRRSLPGFVAVSLSVLAAFSASRTAQAQPYTCSAGTTCFSGAATIGNVSTAEFETFDASHGAVNAADTGSGIGVWGGSSSFAGLVGATGSLAFFSPPSGLYGVFGEVQEGTGIGVAGDTGSGTGVYGN